MKNLSLFFVLMLSLTFFQSCVQDEDNLPNDTEKTAPDLPPVESFIMSFEGYSEAEVDTAEVISNGGADTRTSTFHNWAFAGGNVLVWNVAISVSFAVPVISFREAFNHEPVYVGNGVFAWNYNVNHGLDFYSATLTGEFINDNEDVQWIMTVSKVGGFSNFEYYRGVVAVDGTQANWTLNHQPNNPTPAIDVDFSRHSTGGATIRYTNVNENSQDIGDYIEHSTQPGEDYNRAYDIFRANTNNFIEIEWDIPAGNGRVKNQAHFGDEVWHCWDEDQVDIDC